MVAKKYGLESEFVRGSLIVLLGYRVCVLCVLVLCGWLWEYFMALGATEDFVVEFVGRRHSFDGPCWATI